MENFWKSTKMKVILGILALLVGVMVYAVSVGGYTISTVDFFSAITAPFQRASHSISEHVEYSIDVYRNAEKNYEDNRALRREVARLSKELADYDQTKNRLEELEAFVGIKEMYTDVTMSAPCRVTGYVTNDPFGKFRIDAGTQDGLSLWDPVVTEQGLVGVITEIGADTSTVTTVLSPDLSIAAYCSTTRDYGVLTGSVALSIDGMCKLQYLDKETLLKEDKVILTSGDNGLFPKGFVIGYVRGVQMDYSGMTAYASVEPAEDIRNLDLVTVITDFAGKSEELP